MSHFSWSIWITWFMLSVCIVVPTVSGQSNLAEPVSSVLPPVGLPPWLPWRINRTLTATHDPIQPGLINAPLSGSVKRNQTVASPNLLNKTRTVLIDQSRTCTPQQDAEQIQCLRELPAESYEVLEGEDVQMRCRVAHQRGKAQWRARSFLLGYKRNIPSWPRYSMQGDPRLGIHDLVITNVTHEDAGTYECQVSPVAGQSPLRRQTTLSILVKPSQPVIVAPSGEPQPSPNGRLTVPLRKSTPGERNLLRLSCKSHGGSPPPKFEWFHNGVMINTTTKSGATQSTESSNLNNALTSKRAGIESHSAELVLDKEKLRTGDRLVCLISNKATLRSKKLSQQKLRTELYVVIHSPPGNPEIIDWSFKSNGSQILTVGMPLEATCRSSPAGNPPGELIWRWESTQPTQSSDGQQDKSILKPSTVNGVPPVITPVPTEYAIQQFVDEKLLSKVRIPHVNASQHGMDLVCAVKHQIGPEKNARIPVLVRYGPRAVDIHGPEETIDLLKDRLEKLMHQVQPNRNRPLKLNASSSVRYVYQDRPQYLLCLTSPYFDQAQIQWYGLLNISGQWHPIAPVESFTRVLPTGEKNFILASMIQLVSTNSERTPLRWTAIKCVTKPQPNDMMGHSGDFGGINSNKAVLKLVDLKGYIPPGVPSISGYKHNMLYQEGTNITLHCEARAGTPPGTLIWLDATVTKMTVDKSDQSTIVSNSTTQLGPDGMIRSSLTIQLTREVNGRFYRCASLSEGFPQSDERVSDSVQLGVAFAATRITMTVADETGRALFPRDNSVVQIPSPNQSLQFDTSHNPPVISAHAGGKVAVKCRMDLSNPQPKIQWRLYRCPTNTINMSNHIPFKELTNDCVVETIQGSEQSVVEKTMVQSQVVLLLNWSHHGDIIECMAEPQVPWTLGPDQMPLHIKDGISQPRLRERVLMNIQFAPLFLRPAQHLNWPVEKLHVGLFKHRLPQYIVVDGGSVDLDLEPSANPEVTSFVWYKNEETIPPAPASSSDNRIVAHKSVLRIRPVRATDMANYTLLATNALGTARFRFFLNVTYGPQLIGPPIINITVAGRKAQLECQARANPTPSTNAVHWRRLSHSFAHLDPVHKFYRTAGNTMTTSETSEQKQQQHQSIADSVTGIRCNKGTWHNGFKYFAKCWNPSPGVLASSLTIYDLGPSDVGRYQCHMDNAIGSPAVRIVDLIYPFAPQVIPVPRWARAAPGMGYSPTENVSTSSSESDHHGSSVSQARLTCVIAAEPIPTVEWVREPANLTLVEGGQFRTKIKAVRPGLYHAVLYLNKPRDVDMGKYYCKATNLVGEDAGQVELVASTRPDSPTTPRLLNATSTTLAVAWTQGFNGGPHQTFKLRWALNENPDKFMEADISEDLDSETIAYEIRGLQKATSYRVAVSASNSEHGTTGFTQYLLASTTARDPVPDKEAMHDEARVKSLSAGHWDTKGSGLDEDDDSQRRLARAGLDVQNSEDKAVVIIIAASIFGSLVLIANLLIIIFLAQRRRKKLHQQRRSSLFTGNELVQLCPTTNPYGGDMTMNSRPSYTGYMDGSSLNEDMLLQNRSSEHFMAYHPNLSPVAVNICSDGSNIIKSNNSFTGSPHPSLQAINPLGMPSPVQVDYNSNALQLPQTNLGESDLTGMTYVNTDASPPVGITDYNQHAAMYAINERGLAAPIVQQAERRTPLSIRMNSGVPVYPQVVQRMDSPNSGAASSISAARSAGYPNSNSLERNGFFIAPPRTPSQHNMAALIRQTSFGQTTTPNGTFGRPIINYGQSPSVHQTGSRSGSSSFTPTHTLMNGRMRTNPMAMSYYTERGPGSNPSYGDRAPSGELTPSMGTGQLIRRGSYNTYKPQNAAQRMNTSQLLDTYLQRYNDQLQSVRLLTTQAMNQQIAPGRYICEPDNARNITDQFRSPVMRPTGLEVQTHGNAESTIIPPPNAFGPHSPHGPNVPIGPDPDRSLHHGSDIDESQFSPSHGLSTTATVRPSLGNLIRSTQINNTSNAPVKHPTPNQSLIYQDGGQDGYPRYGCIV